MNDEERIRKELKAELRDERRPIANATWWQIKRDWIRQQIRRRSVIGDADPEDVIWARHEEGDL